MERIRELLTRITELSDDELAELKDLVLQELDSQSGDAQDIQSVEMAVLEELAEASTAVKTEFSRRADERARRTALASQFTDLRGVTLPEPGSTATAPAPVPASTSGTTELPGTAPAPPVSPAPSVAQPNVDGSNVQSDDAHGGHGRDDDGASDGDTQVPDDRRPRPQRARTTVIRAGADLPGFAMGQEITGRDEIARAMVRRIQTMRGIRGGDGDKLIVASATLEGIGDEYRLKSNDPEGNFAKVNAVTAPHAIIAAGGLAAPEESKYDLYGVGVTDRPVRDSLPVYVTERGGVRFMRPPTLNDLNGSVGVWTVQNDIDAVTDVNVRKPRFRVTPGPEIVVETQAITSILVFGNLATRAYPEMVARHNDLALIAHSRVAEQQLLTQIGALSTAVTGRTQRLSAASEVLLQVDQAAESYVNRHRTGETPLKSYFPRWFKALLRADVAMEMPGDGLERYTLADAVVDKWFSDRNINITWTMDGEAGQDYSAITDGATPAGIAPFPTSVIWYLFAEGTFAFMDGGTLDLGLVRDSVLNETNDYEMFTETFENVVKFGNESLRVRSYLKPSGVGASAATPYA